MSKRPRPTSLFLIDDHVLLREAIAMVLAEEQDFVICGQADDIRTAIPLIKKTGPEVVILDLALPSGAGVQGIREITDRFPSVKVLVFSGQNELIFGIRSLRAGASGYVEKAAPAGDLVTALRRVADGGVALSDAVQSQMVQTFARGNNSTLKSPIQRLTDRELEIFILIGQGKKSRDIARLLNVSPKTVEAHRLTMRRKLQLPNAAALLHMAIRHVRSPEVTGALDSGPAD